MISVCRPPDANLRYLRLTQECDSWQEAIGLAIGTHRIAVVNLDPARRQRVDLEYTSDSAQVRLCDCGSMDECSDPHRSHTLELRSKADYWSGERKSLMTRLNWYHANLEADFTLTIDISSTLQRHRNDLVPDTDTTAFNTYTTRT